MFPLAVRTGWHTGIAAGGATGPFCCTRCAGAVGPLRLRGRRRGLGRGLRRGLGRGLRRLEPLPFGGAAGGPVFFPFALQLPLRRLRLLRESRARAISAILGDIPTGSLHPLQEERQIFVKTDCQQNYTMHTFATPCVLIATANIQG